MKVHQSCMTGAGLALAGVLVVSGGCASTAAATVGSGPELMATMPDVQDAMIQMRRGGCAATPCPVYSLSIFMDGTVLYDGRANVATVGQQRAKLTSAQVSELVSAIDAMRFLDTAERCCVCPETEAFQSQMVVLDYRPGSSQKTVIHDDACRNAPPSMSALEETIDRLANVTRWTSPVVAGVASSNHLR